MSQNIVETIIGFLVIAVAGFFVFYSEKFLSRNDKNFYEVLAKFQSAEGISIGSDVMISGIKVGFVESVTIDKISYDAVVKLKISQDIKIPVDSIASIVSSGFLGGKFISLTPGIEDNYLESGQYIAFTQPSLNLESLIGKFMYSTQSN